MWDKSGREAILHRFGIGAGCHTRLAAVVIQSAVADKTMILLDANLF